MALTTTEDVAALLGWGTAEVAARGSELTAFVNAASEVVESEAGPFEEREVEHTADGGSSIQLPYRVSQVSSVQTAADTGYEWVDGFYVPTEGWQTDVSWTLDKAAGIIYGAFPHGRQNVKVTFTTGLDPVPESAKLATAMLAAHLWEVAAQRGPAVSNEWTPVPTGFAVPNRVKELLAQFTVMPGFA